MPCTQATTQFESQQNILQTLSDTNKSSCYVSSTTQKENENFVLWRPNDKEYNMSRPVAISNGSVLGFADSTVIGKLIRFLSDDAQNGFSHVGMAIVAKPSQILEMIQESAKSGGLANRKKKYLKEQLRVMYEAYPYLCDAIAAAAAESAALQDEPLDVFCFESSGTAGDVLRGLGPRVQISPLAKAVDEYDGNVCVRSLYEPILLESLHNKIVETIGVSYEKHITQLLKSTSDGNKVEDESSWFCSELVAALYKTAGVVKDVCANNVIPKDFSTHSKEDLLKGNATDEMWLKIKEKSM
jgi:hypothetical protein